MPNLDIKKVGQFLAKSINKALWHMWEQIYVKSSTLYAENYGTWARTSILILFEQQP